MMRLGVPASGPDYFYNEGPVERVLTAAREGETLIIVGPRRAGKTSLMRAAASRLARQERSFEIRHADLSHMNSPWTLLRELDPSPDERRNLIAHQSRPRRRDNPEELIAALQGALDRFVRKGAQTVLFLDEVDWALQKDDERLWTEILNRLAARPRLSLIMSAEPYRLQMLRERRDNRHFLDEAEILELKPWSETEIATFIRVGLENVPADRARPDAAFVAELTAGLAPAWPYEVIIAMIEFDELRGEPTSVTDLLNRAAERISGTYTLDDFALMTLNKREAAPALFFLEALAHANDSLSIDAAADFSEDKYAASELARAAQRLEALGLIAKAARDGRSYRPATGLTRLRLARDFAESGAAA